MTFTLTIKTAEDRAQEGEMARRNACAAECRRRIIAVVGETNQINISGAAAAGLLSEADLAIYANAILWVAEMRAAWAPMAASAADFTDDAQWPPVPDGVRALFAGF